ncbi:MAG: hypothetical protein ACJAQ3_001863, partial [Planctomycetota bacterium]
MRRLGIARCALDRHVVKAGFAAESLEIHFGEAEVSVLEPVADPVL